MRTNKQQVAPTTTAAQCRVALYQPTQRPVQTTGEWIDTTWGRCRVTGRLGQRHADVIESILHCAEKKQTADGVCVEVLVDPAQIRRTLSDKSYSHARLWSLLREIMAAVIEIETPEFRAMGHLISTVFESAATKPDPLTGGVRHLWRVRLGDALITLVGNDLHLYRDPAPIARLQHGISQAVVRHILSHKNEPRGGWYMDSVLQAVAGRTVTGQWMRDRRREMRADADGIAEMGISIDGDRIRKK